MKLGTLNAWVTKQRDGRVSYDFGDGTKYVEANSYVERRILGLAKYFKGAHTFEEKCQVFNQVCDSIGESDKKLPLKDDGSLVIEDKTELATVTIEKLINFFSEFEFEPNFRFINTLCYNCYSLSAAKDYIKTYFELADNAYANAINDKMKSEEFKKIVDDFSQIAPSHKVNNRFKLYYGSAGTGKTTLAMKEAENCMVCHSAMLPSDLMEDFKFVDGKAEFQPSSLQNAITEGTVVVLDEINLLPFESLRFLQSILDGKAEFEYKGKTIKIAEGFKIIGTMNLTVNGSVYSLPEPLVDRCEQIKKFKLTAKDLAGALI